MKISLSLSALMAIAFLLAGWKSQRDLHALSEHRNSLRQEAASLGISQDQSPGLALPAPAQPRRSNPADRTAQAKDYAKRLTSFALEMEALENSKAPHSEELQKKANDMEKQAAAILSEMASLDSAQMKVLVAELQANPALSSELRNGILGLALMTLGEKNPLTALTLAAEISDPSKPDRSSKKVVESCLKRMAEDNPATAVDWLREHATSSPSLVDDGAKIAVLAWTARNDPGLAFSLMEELGLGNTAKAATSIAGAASTDEMRAGVLASFREYAAKHPDSADKLRMPVIMTLAPKVIEGGFESASKWFEAAALDDKEVSFMVKQMGEGLTKSDTGKWLDWMSGRVSDEVQQNKTTQMVTQWTYTDWQAVENWISSSQDGPAHDTAVRAYAETVAQAEPANAAKWAETLPDDSKRETLLRKIYDQWKSKDAAAAASFADRHGLK